MKRIITVLAVLASLALAPTALAHPNVTGSATQVCDANKVKLEASFSNAGFDQETTVTATDSQAGSLGTLGSPATFTATFNVSDRDAGTVTFDWTAGNDSGTVVASYEAVSGCVAPPPPPPPPPPNHPPAHHHTGGPPHISTAPHGSSPTPEAKPAPQAIKNGELPFSGMPLGLMAAIAAGLLVGGIYSVRKLAD